MPYIKKYYYPEENPYKVGDHITWHGISLIVGDDFEELHHWRGENGEKTHIVTTDGRVLSIDEINNNDKPK